MYTLTLSPQPILYSYFRSSCSWRVRIGKNCASTAWAGWDRLEEALGGKLAWDKGVLSQTGLHPRELAPPPRLLEPSAPNGTST